MNVAQSIIVIFVTSVILVCLSVGVTFISPKLDAENVKLAVLIQISSITLLIWIFFVFISDLYMTINKLTNKIDTYQDQVHSTILKKYVENSHKKCDVDKLS